MRVSGDVIRVVKVDKTVAQGGNIERNGQHRERKGKQDERLRVQPRAPPSGCVFAIAVQIRRIHRAEISSNSILVGSIPVANGPSCNAAYPPMRLLAPFPGTPSSPHSILNSPRTHPV